MKNQWTIDESAHRLVASALEPTLEINRAIGFAM